MVYVKDGSAWPNLARNFAPVAEQKSSLLQMFDNQKLN